jgi:hexosaminidase
VISKPIFIFLTASILFFSTIIFGQEDMKAIPLMPVPKQITYQAERFRLTEDFTIAVKGRCHERMYKYATRTLRRLSDRAGLFFPQDFITKEKPGNEDSASFLITVRRPGKVKLYENESYHLFITSKKILLNAETDIDALRGMETFLQLLNADEKGYYFPGVDITDAPRFPWRGLMLDVSRHFMPLKVIKRNLRGMAAVKMNVFHWHLSDDQGFRVECKTFPKLHEMGSDGFYYTQDQIREIIAYANDLGIRVVPEFDVPAHTTSWFVGYPELASAPGPYTIERHWGIKDPVMNPTRKKTYEFLDKFFKEMSALFPDEYMHIGGDENNGKQWDANQDIQNYMKKNNIKDNHALQSYFNRRMLKILTKYHKKMIGWDEILQPDLPNSIVIQSWRGHESLDNAARQGYKGILSNGYYIDLMQPASFHYLNDPIPDDTSLTDEQKENILGGEATSWSELVSPETVDSRIWPRTAAIAERLWSPQNIRDVEDMYKRLEFTSFRLEELGLTHRKNYPMMLRRLTNNTDITALKTLVDVLEPVKKYERHHQGVTYTSYSPLSRVVDAARPESMSARRFSILIDSLIANPKTSLQLEIVEMLKKWRKNHRDLKETIKISPILHEIETLSQDLETIAEIGLEAGNHYTSGIEPTDSWIEHSLKALEETKKPRGQTELMVVEPIERLVKAVAEQGN